MHAWLDHRLTLPLRAQPPLNRRQNQLIRRCKPGDVGTVQVLQLDPLGAQSLRSQVGGGIVGAMVSWAPIGVYAAWPSSASTRRFHSGLSSRQPSSVRERFQ